MSVQGGYHDAGAVLSAAESALPRCADVGKTARPRVRTEGGQHYGGRPYETGILAGNIFG